MRHIVLPALLVLCACTSSPPPAAPAPRSAPGVSAVMKEPAATDGARLGVLAPGTGIAVGQKVPDLSALDLQGHDVRLSSLYEKETVLLIFYRGGWCPYCNAQIHALTAAYPEFARRGVQPVAVSVDRPDVESKLKARYEIPFPVLSDRHAAMIGGFHVARTVSDDELSQRKAHGVDLEDYAGEDHHQIAIPAMFLIDRHGVVRWAHSDPEFKVRPSITQILAVIDGVHVAG